MQPHIVKNHMEKEEVYSLLDKCNEGVLATIGNDGYPYGTPINYVRIGEVIYFHGRPAGEKVENLAACPKVCLTVMETSGFEYTGPESCNTATVYESAIVRGTAEKATNPAEKIDALKALVAKLVPGRMFDGMGDRMIDAVAVYAIRIESATGKFHRPMHGNRVTH